MKIFDSLQYMMDFSSVAVMKGERHLSFLQNFFVIYESHVGVFPTLFYQMKNCTSLFYELLNAVGSVVFCIPLIQQNTADFFASMQHTFNQVNKSLRKIFVGE